MTDLERKLAETLREQAGEVTPNLDAAWAEQQRRQRRPRMARRRLTLVVAPLAAVLVVLTSVLLATQVQTTTPGPVPPANLGPTQVLASLGYRPMSQLEVTDTPVALTDFAGQTDSWTSYAFSAVASDQQQFCLEAVTRGRELDFSAPQFGPKSPFCAPVSVGTVRAGYVGENDGPLPPGTAVYLVDPKVKTLRVYDAKGDLSLAKPFGTLLQDQVFFVRFTPDSPPTRFEVS
jgi:hypothetical protein